MHGSDIEQSLYKQNNNHRNISLIDEENDLDPDDWDDGNIEAEQGKSSTAGKMQNALLKQSTPELFAQYAG